MKGYKIYKEDDSKSPIYTISEKVTKNKINEMINEIKSYVYEVDYSGDNSEYDRMPTDKEYNEFYKELQYDCSKTDELIKEYPLIRLKKANKSHEILFFCKTYIDKRDDYINVCCDKIVVEIINILSD